MKLIGVLMCLLSTTYIGIYMGEMEKKRYYALINVKKMMQLINGEIQYKQIPLAEVFYYVSKKVDKPLEQMLLQIYKQTEQLSDVFENIWQTSITQNLSKYGLKREDIEQLNQCFRCRMPITITVVDTAK